MVMVIATSGLFAWRVADAEAAREKEAMWRYSQIVNNEDSDAFLVRRQLSPVDSPKAEPAELAWRHLDRYGVLKNKDWRLRDDVHGLPEPARTELEIWLLEQSLRYAHALAARSDAEDAWRRALLCLENSSPQTHYASIEAHTRRLRRLLRQPNPAQLPPVDPDPNRLWMNDYLLGIEAELYGEVGAALDHYLRVLEDRPESFWANYRAAAVESKLRDFYAAANHLRVCVAQHPESAVLHRLYAGCLLSQRDYIEAEKEYEKAKNLDPEQPETFLSRAFLHARLKQEASFKSDMVSYEVLKGLRVHLSTNPLASVSHAAGDVAELDELVGRSVDKEIVHNWCQLGKEFLSSKQNELALEQFTQVLANDSDNIEAHWGRAVALGRLDRDGSISEYARVVEHPQIEAWARIYPTAVYAFEFVAVDLIDRHQSIAAVEIARRGSVLADHFKKNQARLHFVLARAYAHASRDEPSLARLVRGELKKSEAFHDKNFKAWLSSDPIFRLIESSSPELTPTRVL